MKSRILAFSLLALLVAPGCDRPRPDPKSAVRVAGSRTFSSFDPPTPGENLSPAGSIRLEQVNLDAVLKLYAETSGRTIIRAANLPDITVTLFNQTPLTTVELLQTLDTVLAAQGIAMVFLGTQYVKAVPAAQAHQESGPVIELEPGRLPDSSSYLTYIVKLKKVKGSQAVPALQPFAKLPNSILMIPSDTAAAKTSKAGLPNLPASLFGTKDDLLVLRDYSSNIRRMLLVLEKMEER